jgi:hypothetical protein
MSINHIADQFLHAYQYDGVFEGGLSFRKAMAKTRLDSTPESLARIDHLLGKIHTRFNPSRIDFIKNPANVNFLYLLSFYIGHVIATSTGATLKWYAYDELQTAMPEQAALFPPGFSSSITCVVSGGSSRAGFFAPLPGIEARLFEDSPLKSLATRASAFMQAI